MTTKCALAAAERGCYPFKGGNSETARGLNFGVGGHMTTAAGYDPQIVEHTGLDEVTAFKMKLAVIGFQCVRLLLAIVIKWL
jgi:hypothetical protein